MFKESQSFETQFDCMQLSIVSFFSPLFFSAERTCNFGLKRLLSLEISDSKCSDVNALETS